MTNNELTFSMADNKVSIVSSESVDTNAFAERIANMKHHRAMMLQQVINTKAQIEQSNSQIAKSQGFVTEIEADIARVTSFMESNNLTDLKTKVDEVTKKKLAAAMITEDGEMVAQPAQGNSADQIKPQII